MNTEDRADRMRDADWVDVQAAFHDYSYRNALLIKRQYPKATCVAGYQTRQEKFAQHVCGGESAS